MHTTKDYSGLSEDEKQIKAISDIRDWLGVEKFNKLEREFKLYGPVTEEQFGFLCSIAGISGYPVTAWYRSIYAADENDVIEP